jgi:hypothetical protein
MAADYALEEPLGVRGGRRAFGCLVLKHLFGRDGECVRLTHGSTLLMTCAALRLRAADAQCPAVAAPAPHLRAGGLLCRRMRILH